MAAHVCQALLDELAPAAGLSASIEPFSQMGDARQGGSLRERLANNPLLMAPMAGVSDAAWRLMARAGGAVLAYTEMVSVTGIHYGGDKTWELVIPNEAEPDIAVQLFGSKPEQFREATAAICERLGEKLALIDINMACPVPKVTRKGEGSALLDDPDRASDIVRACLVEAGDVPVTAKIRSGRVPHRIVAPEFARALEQAGVAAVTVHGRTASQLYRGEADWGVVRDVVEAVDLPVIGSGDVLTAETAAMRLTTSGATAVMIARGTYGNPWIFHDARGVMEADVYSNLETSQRETSPLAPLRPLGTRLNALRLHIRLMDAVGTHMARGRSLCAWYLKGIPDAAAWRNRAMACRTTQDFLDTIDAVEREVS
ncbi:MAG: tRNA-dihydrouridine synthase [Atopobiaceae bacterium]|nr:tRNA-dihydrouridine synthase [Atopobiaceae bacterium]